MPNEFILFATAVISMAFVLAAYRHGKEWLYIMIVVNLLLIGVFGAKLIPVFGFVTNAGNIFYASIFLAVHLLTEHYGKEAGYRSAWIGLGATLIFYVMGQFTLLLAGAPDSRLASEAMRILFSGAPRIAFASALAFVVVNTINVRVYDHLKAVARRDLWLRDTVANVAGQLADSVLFFTLAFYGSLPAGALFQAMFVGFIVKVLAGVVGTPFLYGSYHLKTVTTDHVNMHPHIKPFAAPPAGLSKPSAHL